MSSPFQLRRLRCRGVRDGSQGLPGMSEPRTIYAADGTPTGTVMIHFLAHTTVDTHTGEASASIERFFFTCS